MSTDKKNLFILLSGHNASGKSFVASRLVNHFKLNFIRPDSIRELLIKEVNFFKDADFSYPSEKAVLMRPMVQSYRKDLCKVLLDRDASILLEDAGPTKALRKEFFNLAKQTSSKVITILISLEIEEQLLINRLKERDVKEPNSRWERQYSDVKRSLYEIPTEGEADYLLKYDQRNLDSIVAQIMKILGNCDT